MANYPITSKPEDLTKLIRSLPSIPFPSKSIDVDFFKKLGFSSSSSKSLKDVLKAIGFVTNEDAPTELWRSYIQDDNRGLILAKAIKHAYQDLFTFTVCPYLENDQEIFDMFKRASASNARQLTLMLQTFRALSDLADFQELLDPNAPAGSSADPVADELSVKINPNLQLNIQIHIDPATPDEKIDTIFKSLRKHLLGKSDS
jgi:hypothetical protein